MARLEAELDAVGLLKTAANPQPRTITFADIGKLHYLDVVIKVGRPPSGAVLGFLEGILFRSEFQVWLLPC